MKKRKISAQVLSITTGRTYNYGDLVWAVTINHPNGHRGKVLGAANVNDLWIHYIIKLIGFKPKDRYITVRHDLLRPRTLKKKVIKHAKAS